MKKANKFLAVLFLCASMGLAACSFPAEFGGSSASDSSSQNARNPQIEAIYNLYAERTQAAGGEPLSYEDWLASIKGEKGEPGQNGQDGHSPVVAINSEGYWTIDGVNTGVKATGDPGQPGQQGKDGTSLHIGSGQPNANLGKEGDSYINSDNWDFYLKSANGWQLVGNIKGANGQNGSNGSNGQNGTNGSSLKTGSGAPDAELGETGDSYIDTDTWNFYRKTASGWEYVGNIKGADGQNGKDGTNGTDGKDGKDGTNGTDGKDGKDGENGQDGKDGKDGENGQDGKDGKDGQTAWSNTILPSEHGYITVNVGSALVGTPVTFTAHPDNDYYLSELELNGVSVIAGVVNNSYTTEMVENGFVVRAIFSQGQAPVHVHDYGEYRYDSEQHWQQCTCGDIINKGNHEFGDWTTDVQPTEQAAGHKYRTCSVCNYVQEDIIPALAHQHTSDGSWQSNATGHYHVCAGCGEIYEFDSHDFEETNRQDATDDQDGFVTETCRVCGYVRQTVIPANKKTIRVMATNDIHGQIYQETSVDNEGNPYATRAGIDKTMTFLKNEKAKGNTLLIDQGDTWQGSAYSNYDHGGLLTDLMNYVQYDARTIGNHDFDWGLEPIETNAKKSYAGYTTPTLAANIYDYDFVTKTEGDVQQAQLGVPSVTYTFDGVKVGIIGTIGSTDYSSQITSICTNNVKNIIFKKHIPIIKQEAERLRNEENCDIVILSHHGDQDDLTGNNLNQFIDLALCGHSHQYEHFEEGNLLYVQSQGNNRQLWEIDLKINLTNRKIEDEVAATTYAASYIAREVADQDVDSTITGLINDNYARCLREVPLNDVVANNVTGSFGASTSAANLMADAVYEAAEAEGYDIICSYVNNARHDLYNGEWTYADVYEAFPFENEIYIMDITAADMVNEIGKWNYVCKDMSKWPTDGFDVYDTTTKYRIAVIDYLGVHSGVDREYDYFPSCNGETVGVLSKKYRPILVDYLDNHDFDNGVALNTDDYNSDLVAKFKRVGCAPTKAFELTFMYNYEGADVYQTVTGRQNQPYSNFYPVAPQRDGYTFAGWYLDAACTKPATGYITENKTLYASWVLGSFYSMDFTMSSLLDGEGNYRTGEQTFTVPVSNGTDTINVNVAFENVGYYEAYNEITLNKDSGMMITLPDGYVIKSYNIQSYKNYIELYSNASMSLGYPAQGVEGASSRFTWQDSGLNYSSLYIHNANNNPEISGGRSYLYGVHLDILPTNYAPASQSAMPNSGYGLRFLDGSFMNSEYVGKDGDFDQYRIQNRMFLQGQEFQLFDFANRAGWTVAIDGYSFGGSSANDTKWENYLSNDGTRYTVLQDFNVSAIYIKMLNGRDQIYIALA